MPFLSIAPPGCTADCKTQHALPSSARVRFLLPCNNSGICGFPESRKHPGQRKTRGSKPRKIRGGVLHSSVLLLKNKLLFMRLALFFRVALIRDRNCEGFNLFIRFSRSGFRVFWPIMEFWHCLVSFLILPGLEGVPLISSNAGRVFYIPPHVRRRAC